MIQIKALSRELAIVNNISITTDQKHPGVEGLVTPRDEESEFIQNIKQMSDNVYCYRAENPDMEGATILAYCDSMLPDVMHFISQNTKNLVFIQKNDMNPEIIDLVNPDCVIYSLAERRLDELIDFGNDFLALIE